MERIDAFVALFGDDPDQASSEAVGALGGDLEVTDDELEVLDDDVVDRAEAFAENPDDYIKHKEEDDARKQLLRALAALLPEDEEEEGDDGDAEAEPTSAPADTAAPALRPVTADAMAGILAAAGSKKPTAGSAASKSSDNDEDDGKGGRKRDSTRPVHKPLPPKIATGGTGITPGLRRLFADSTWCAHRELVEAAINKIRSADEDDQAAGTKTIADAKFLMGLYARGHMGAQLRFHGRYMLRVIAALEQQVDVTAGASFPLDNDFLLSLASL